MPGRHKQWELFQSTSHSNRAKLLCWSTHTLTDTRYSKESKFLITLIRTWIHPAAFGDLKYQKLIMQLPLDSFNLELFTWAFSSFSPIAVASRYRNFPEMKLRIPEKLFLTFKLDSMTKIQQYKCRDMKHGSQMHPVLVNLYLG